VGLDSRPPLLCARLSHFPRRGSPRNRPSILGKSVSGEVVDLYCQSPKLGKRKLKTTWKLDGYVCDFTNRTFATFVLEHTGIEIYSENILGLKLVVYGAFWDTDSDSQSKSARWIDWLLETSKLAAMYGYQVVNPFFY